MENLFYIWLVVAFFAVVLVFGSGSLEHEFANRSPAQVVLLAVIWPVTLSYWLGAVGLPWYWRLNQRAFLALKREIRG